MSPTPCSPTETSAFFPRLFQARSRRLVGPVDAIPFINVILLAFFYYISQAPFVLQPGVRLDLPAAAFTDGVPYDALVVTVSQEGMVFFNDQRTSLEELRAGLRQTARNRRDPALIVEADGGVKHRTLVEIYNMAIEAGIRRVSLATRIAAPGGGEGGP
jgi:biopolymer transport protein ExbD